MSEVQDEFPHLLFSLIRRFNIQDRDQKVCYGLTMSQSLTVECVANTPMITMNNLSSNMGLSISTMTRIVDVLVRDNILKREKNTEDRRQVCIDLTPKGKTLSKKLAECSCHFAKSILMNIPPSDRKKVMESVQILLKAADCLTDGTCCSG